MRRYRIRLHDGRRELLDDRTTVVALDLTTGPGLHEARPVLDGLLRSLAAQAWISDDRVHLCYLAVEDLESRTTTHHTIGS